MHLGHGVDTTDGALDYGDDVAHEMVDTPPRVLPRRLVELLPSRVDKLGEFFVTRRLRSEGGRHVKGCNRQSAICK